MNKNRHIGEVKKLIKELNEINPKDINDYDYKYGNLQALLVLYKHLGGTQDLIPEELTKNRYFREQIENYTLFYELKDAMQNSDSNTLALKKMNKVLTNFKALRIEISYITKDNNRIPLDSFNNKEYPFEIIYKVKNTDRYSIMVTSNYDFDEFIFVMLNEIYFKYFRYAECGKQLTYINKYSKYSSGAEGIKLK